MKKLTYISVKIDPTLKNMSNQHTEGVQRLLRIRPYPGVHGIKVANQARQEV